MALVSPGVQVTVIDESQYIPAATNSVPFVLVATAQNKISGTGAGVAAGTLKANAGKVYLISSQRDLAATFGNPFFYKTAAGTPINGYELNEYGLLAAHSVLGISNLAYVQRADVDLAELTASLVRPTGSPPDGTYWLDTSLTSWGVFQWNQTTGAFAVQPVIIIEDTDYLTLGIPSQDIGSIGDYAVVTTNTNNPIYYKNSENLWVLVGSDAWKTSWPTVQGTNSVVGQALTAGDYIAINGAVNIQVPAAPNNTVEGLANAINAEDVMGVTAAADSSNRLVIYADSTAEGDGSSYTSGVVVSGTSGLLTTLGITAGSYLAPALQSSANYSLPRWRTSDTEPRPTGSIWNMITPVNRGAYVIVKQYDATIGGFLLRANPIYGSEAEADYSMDPTGGGRNIPVGTIWTQYNSQPEEYDEGMFNNTLTFKVYERFQIGSTIIVGGTNTPVFVNGTEFTLSASGIGNGEMSDPVTVTINGTTAADFVAAVSAANVPYVSASVASNGAIAFIHSAGGVIELQDVSGTPITGASAANFNTDITGVRTNPYGGIMLSPYQALTYTASSLAPDQNPADGRKWYYSATDQVDIMIQDDGEWMGYQNVTNDVRGYDLTQTNPTGPIISTTAPTEQTDGTSLVYGDLWIDSSDLENYPIINRWQQVEGVDQWVTLNNNDQTTSNGVLFADARWAPNGTTDPVAGAYPTISSLLTSDYLDMDAPDSSLYPQGMLLWNTRRSGFNVKAFQRNYFNGQTFSIEPWSPTSGYSVNNKVLFNGIVYVCTAAPPVGTQPSDPDYWAELQTNTWTTVSGNRADGSPYMGRKAVRQIVVAAMKSALDTQDTLREEQNEFNLIACPQYPELIPNMVALNNERNNTAFVVGDTPLRLGPDGNSLVGWATNQGGLGIDGESGITTSDPYLAVFYPQCQTTDLSGSPVVQPASHMMLRTIVRSDEVAYPWLAPAGVRRGVIDNAERIGYVDSLTGEFVTIATGQGVRDILYTNKINPITFIPGVGITNYGNKTEAAVASAMDRINVARLVAYIRGRLQEIGKQYVFEPNDQITRNEIKNAIDGLMIDLVAKRGIYDYLVVCDSSNNTPARIDRNELYVDIAIEPVKAVEFIYIPVRIKNTGEIAAGI